MDKYAIATAFGYDKTVAFIIVPNGNFSPVTQREILIGNALHTGRYKGER